MSWTPNSSRTAEQNLSDPACRSDEGASALRIFWQRA
jgi:hypothetical protein